MTRYFSLVDYRPMRSIFNVWVGCDPYSSFLTSSSFLKSLVRSYSLAGGILTSFITSFSAPEGLFYAKLSAA